MIAHPLKKGDRLLLNRPSLSKKSEYLSVKASSAEACSLGQLVSSSISLKMCLKI